MNDADNMKLPEGFTCGDCRTFAKCEAFGITEAGRVECDWAPSRFAFSVNKYRDLRAERDALAARVAALDVAEAIHAEARARGGVVLIQGNSQGGWTLRATEAAQWRVALWSSGDTLEETLRDAAARQVAGEEVERGR